jgi:exopolysaccharide biosynthesis polyprenyl glycosylphosphotransferase
MKIKNLILLFLDIFSLYLGLFFALYLRYFENFKINIFINHLLPFSLIYFFWILLFYSFGFYEDKFFEQRLDFIIKILECFLFCFLFGLTFFYFNQVLKITPKTILLLNIFFSSSLFYFFRRFFYKIFLSQFKVKIAFLGKSKISLKLVQKIFESPHLGFEFLGFLDKNKDIFLQLEDLKPDCLVISEDIKKNKKILKQLLKAITLGINFVSPLDLYEKLFHKIPVEDINQKWFLENFSEGDKKVYDNIKRIMDIFLAFLFLLLTLPLWLIFAILIKIEDKGAVFYKQKRVGKLGKIFELIKFRSMIEEAEKDGPRWAEKEDKRVTKVGKFLRKTHLDELPQLINILKGEISFVGPRPERPEFVKILERKIPYYHLRHIIKPGFTGWAQIRFDYARSIEDSKEKLEYDLYYIKNRSLFLDLGILLKTIQLLFQK